MGNAIHSLVAWPLPISLMLLGAVLGPLAFNAALLLRTACGARPDEGLAVWRMVSVLVVVPLGAVYGSLYGVWWWLVFRLHWPLGWLLVVGLVPCVAIALSSAVRRRHYDANDWWWQTTGYLSIAAVWLPGAALAGLHFVARSAAA